MTMLKNKAKDPTHAIFGIAPDDSILDFTVSAGPHFLVAGTTGSGKSVFINSLVISMLTHSHPDELKLAIIDPKTVEFTAYKDLPYMLCNPVVDMKKANNLVIYLTIEMDERYKKLADKGVKNLAEYNEKAEKEGFEKLPYIVLVIDEFADLISQFKDVEKPVARIGQKARAAGIHMIIATQSPRREVITGLIKANVPSRVSLMVANSIESQIILDETGGEKLRPRGDFLIKMNGGQATRGQAPYVSNDEIDTIFAKLREMYGAPKLVDFEKAVEEHNTKESTTSEDADGLKERVSKFQGSGSKLSGAKGRIGGKVAGSMSGSKASDIRSKIQPKKKAEPKKVKIDTSKYANMQKERIKKTVRKRKGVDAPSMPQKIESKAARSKRNASDMFGL